jgi:hypothetical protein
MVTKCTGLRMMTSDGHQVSKNKLVTNFVTSRSHIWVDPVGQHRFVICKEMKEQLILGKDFLLKHNVVISGNLISIEGADQSYCKITKQVTIPPNSEILILASTSGVTSVNRVVMLEPSFKSDEDILVARSIGQTLDNKMNVLVQNHSSKPIRLFENTILGNLFDECTVLNSRIEIKPRW